MSGNILLPPSPNWFFIDALDSRVEDSLLVSSVYKSILVQQFVPGEKLPTLLKVIPNQNEKVQSVKLCPIASDPDYGHTVASLCEGSVVRLFNIHSGDIIAEHRQHEGQAVNGICWGNVGGEEVVVTVGEGGRVVVWQPQHNAFQVHTLPQSPELTVVEVNPKDRSQALVAANKNIALVNLKTGWVLTWLKGHDMNIYCMRWYTGEESPLAEDIPINSRAEAMMEGSGKGPESRNKANSWRRNDRGEGSGGGGPYFASSDYGRNIHVWDIAAKRYVTRMTVPVSTGGYKKHTVGKDKSGKMKQHIPLAWHKKELLSSTILGELLQWTCQPGKGRFKALHHLHNRAIYNLEVLGDLVVSSGQDRALQGFDVARFEHIFQLPVMGGCAASLAFCPQDVTRLAIGSIDNTLRLLKFGSPTPLQCVTTSQNIKGKVLSLAWHPEHEGRLLLSTATGQVSWLDVSSCRLNTFAYYHQKAAYKVEWAPPVCPAASGTSDLEAWYAYSFGDREIVMRAPSSPLADPISLKTLVPDPENKAFPRDTTEFSFSPDYKYLALGLNDGQVRVYCRQDLEVVATLVVVKKAIQHLLWKPQREGGSSYTLAVSSNENNIRIFCLDSHLKEFEDKAGEGKGSEVLVTQATRELSGHEARVVWLAWSPHTSSLLASASYDHTVQLWDADNGSMLGNYGGHMTRVFRVEFSPSDPDLMFSCADENTVHSWRPSKLTCKTPAESSALLKEHQHKKEQEPSEEEAAVPAELKENGLAPREGEAVKSSGTPSAKAVCLSDATKKSSGDSGKKAALKSFFPKLHSVCSRKKGFHHLVLLSMLALREAKDAKMSQQKEGAGKDTNEEDLEDLDDEILEEEDQEGDAHPIVVNTTEKYSFLLEKDSEMARIDDFLYVMQMYGQPQQMDALLTSEIEAHEAKDNFCQADLMHCWRGSLGNHIRVAAKQKKLTPFLVASAPQVSLKLWETACEAYAEQLLVEGDVITAASYLLNIHKAEEAVDILLQHKHFREALAIVKSRLGYSQDHLGKVVDRWVSSATYDGNMDLAATLQFSVGKVEASARTLSRRTDPGSLFVSAKLYEAAGNKELAVTSGVMAVREASIKQEMNKVEAFLCHLPGLEWFKVISCLHSLLLRVIQQKDTSCYSYFVSTPENVGETAAETEKGMTCLVDEVRRQWVAQGYSQGQYMDLYQHIMIHFSTQHLPTSVKQLWFLVAVALCKCLLAPSCQLWDQHLTEALKYAVTWGKPDQLLHLTHALLPKGKNDIKVLRSTVPEPVQEETVPPYSLHILWQLYQQAEVALLLSYLANDSFWLRLKNDIQVTAEDNVSQGETQTSDNTPSCCDPAVTTAVGDGVSESESSALTSDNCTTASGGVPLNMEGETCLQGENEKASFSFPASMAELRVSLNSYLGNNDSDFGVALEKLEVASDGLSSPLSLVKKIIVLLKENGHFNSAEVESFLSRLPCDLTSSSAT